MTWGRDGAQRPNGMLQALEIDAIALLRTKGQFGKAVEARLNARHYLLTLGWTVEQINAAQSAPPEARP